MWHVIILLLKIIGIALLSILGILLLLLLTVFFVPVRYRMDAQLLTERRVQARITWFLHFISVPIVYDKDGLKVRVKIFGITVKKLFGDSDESEKQKPPKKKKAKKRAKNAKAQQEPTALDAADGGQPQDAKDGEAKDSAPKDSETKDSALKDSETKKAQKNTAAMASQEAIYTQAPAKETEILLPEKPAPSPEKKEKKKFFLWRILSGILEKLKKLKYTIRMFCVKIRKGLEKIENLKSFFRLECTRNALRLGWGQLLYLLKKLGPRHIRGWLHFGFEDPALTGQVLGGISTVYGFFPKKLELKPDFQQAVLEGELHIRGHFHFITMVGIGWKLWRDKDVKAVYKKIKAGI